MRFSVGALAAAALAAAAPSCGDIPEANELPVAGFIEGSVLYSGPMPCTENGRVVGNAIVLLFDERLLPPPEGLATRSVRFATVPGDVLFQSIADQLPASPDGSRLCPDPNTAPRVTVTGAFDISPVDPGAYQLRGFFDYDGDFHPAFRFSNLPTLGDVTGGAIANATAALAGATPIFTRIEVGDRQDDGTYTIPPNGVRLSGLSVNLARPTPFQRPYGHVAAVQPPVAGQATPPAPINYPTVIELPADFQIVDANRLVAQNSLFNLRIRSGVRPDERDAAKASPFFFHVDTPGKFVTYWWDANRDGVVDEFDRVVGSPGAKALAPIVSFTKLDPSDPIRRTTQAAPRILTSAVIAAPDGTLAGLIASVPTTPTAVDEIVAVIRPTAICIPDPVDRNGETLIVTPAEFDTKNEPVVPEPDVLKGDLAGQLRRRADLMSIAYECLPPGDFAMNIVYETGQAWTTPNESGVCMPRENATGDNAGCTQVGSPNVGRPRLESQSFTFRIGTPANAARCYERASEKFKALCLTPAERRLFDERRLWPE
jgi:hypothetical protein